MSVNILLVDDEPKVLRGLKMIVERASSHWIVVGECTNGQEALNFIREDCPDLVITDIKMPCMDGLELVEQAQAIAPDLKFIVLSGYPDFKFAQKALQLGTIDYILKPPNYKDILATIEKIENMKNKLEIEKENARKEENEEFLKKKNEIVVKILNENNIEAIKNESTDINGYKCFFNKFVMLIIKLDGYSNLIFDMLDERIRLLTIMKQQIIKLAIEKDSCFIDLFNGTFCYLLNVEYNSPIYIKNTVNELRNSLEDTVNSSITIGISRVYNEPLSIKKAYTECLCILRSSVVQKKNAIVNIEDIDTEIIPLDYPIDIEQKYIESLEFLNYEKSIELLDKIIEKFTVISKNDSIRLKSIVTEFVLSVTRKFSEPTERSVLKTEDTIKLYNSINFADSIEEIKDLLVSLTQRLSQDIKNVSSSGCRKVINSIKEFVKSNYFNEISLRQIASDFYMNESYLSDLFKKETGSGFTSYLTQVRVDKAKELLKQLDLKIYEVSEMVGYKNSRYFNKIFKKITGYTPFEYRERGI